MNHTEQFKEALSQLNPNQLKAVEAIDGPVMVVAGPGTGKTQILAARIGNILLKTDVYPENILCLTFTEAATVAMRQRLLKFIGPDAYRVGIFTFHAFCNKVIQENPHHFGSNELDPISALDEMKLIYQLIDELPDGHPLIRPDGNQRFEYIRIKNLFALMKKEDLSAHLISKKVDEYLEFIKTEDEFLFKTNRGGFKKGDLNPRLYNKVARPLKLLRAAAGEFENYIERMKKNSWFDFNDMIQWVLRAFENDENLLLDYQEQFQYFLVDEYQDTNGSQNKIVELLTSYHEVPNLFVVGDEDQSIFRFQGANIENITDLRKRLGEQLNVISLNQNYRSSQLILDVSQKLIKNNTERINANDKASIASNDAVKNLKILPKINIYQNPTQEAIDIVDQIKTLKDSGQDLSEVAVLFRKHKLSYEIIRVLQNNEIPIHVRRTENILDSSLIQNVLSTLRYLQKEANIPFKNDNLLYQILHYPFFSLESKSVSKLASIRADINNGLTSIREILFKENRQHLENTFDDDAIEVLHKIGDELELLLGMVHSQTLQHLVESVINKLGILSFVLNSSSRIELMQELKTLFSFIKSETQRNSRMNVKQFLDLINEIENSNEQSVNIPMQKTIFSENSVTLSTLHSAKGLEFKYVFMIACNSNQWEKSRKPSANSYKFPDNFFDAPPGSEIEELRRLFYVGMTRAEQHLTISYVQRTDEGKELEQSQFVAEVSQAEHIDILERKVNDESYMNYQISLLTQTDKPVFSIYHDDLHNKILEKYAMSVTHLNTYLKCPRSFYFKYILKVPASKNQNMAFGSAIHFALEKLFRKMQEQGDEFPPVDAMLNDFEWYMKRHRESFTETQFNNKLKHGKRIIPTYYNHSVKSWNKVVSVEKNYSGLEIQGVPITGKLDKIEFNGNLATVVDYKTGQHAKAKKRKSFSKQGDKMTASSPKHYHEYGGDYWRQAVFYKILVEQDPLKDWEVIAAEFDFVEPDKDSGEYIKQSVPVTDEDVALVTGQIVSSYQKIMNKEFDKGCNEEYCEWCEFVNSNFQTLEYLEDEDAEITLDS